MQRSGLDDLDLQLIHALQLEPRAPWNVLAGVLGTDAVTLARRWARIETEGYAWITALGGSARIGAGAIVEFSCEPGEVLRAADAAAAVPEIYSIDLTAGRRDFVATLVAADDDQLADFVLDRLGSVPGVRSIRTHVVNDVVRLGSDWTVQALSPGQRTLIPAPRPPRPGAARHIPADLARGIRLALSDDPRAAYAAVGTAVGISAQRAADAIALLRRTGDLVLRTDVAGPHSNWPLAAWYFVQVPAPSLVESAQALVDLPAVQYASITTGPGNLIVAAGARTKPEVLRIEAELERRMPGARIIDRSMVLRVHKHLGRLLDARGRSTGRSVPIP
ncbi:Lrp/AsnC family transcriptional regulator [Agromyces sp. LHK192]|uniref:Lrp/AsnC family transcriptional regulator n=1 Tax=Agromyces sp. LHK192 TaxID=2498704 RepID=UPI0013E2FAF2|nr:Lrp/AsnC family transcriptional regulator [Agromyces sp. LHK192]